MVYRYKSSTWIGYMLKITENAARMVEVVVPYFKIKNRIMIT